MKSIILMLLLIPLCSNAQNIITVGGNGISGDSGDGDSSIQAEISYPVGGRFDLKGNYYFAERVSQRVRKISSSGIISTVAGNGTMGYSGDGGLAIAAELNNPEAVTLDTIGNLYIVDQGNNRIRKVGLTGIITTFAGNGNTGYSGDSGSAILAAMNTPVGIACDTFGNVYFSDYFNFRIRKVDANNIITTYAGNGIQGYNGDGIAATAAQLSNCYGICTDLSGNLYISDYSRVRKIDVITKIITTVAGNGIVGFSGDEGNADSAELDGPVDIYSDSLYGLYIADLYNDRVRKVDTTGIITTVAGNGIYGFSGDGGIADSAELYNPEGVAIDYCGNLYIADEGNNRIRKVIFDSTCGKADTTTTVQNIKAGSFSVYPNPASKDLTITTSPGLSINGEVTIYNMLGQVVYNKIFNVNKTTIDISALPNGVYFVKVNGVYVEKVVKE